MIGNSPCVRGEGGRGVLRAVWRSEGLGTRVTGMEVQSWAYEHPGSGLISFQWSDLTVYCSLTQSCPALCDSVDCSTPGLPVPHQLPDLLKLMSIESVMPSNHLILCHPLLLLPSIFSSIRGFSTESALHIRWPKYWSFSFSISPSIEYSGLISL